MGSDRDWGRRTIHGPYGRMLFSLAVTSLVLIVGYLASPPTAPQGAVPAPGSTTGQPDDGFSNASLSESGDCYFVRGFGLPTVLPDPSPAAAVHGSMCRWVEVTRAQLDSLMHRRVCAFGGSSVPVRYHCAHDQAVRRS